MSSPLLKIRNPQMVPPGGYRWYCPEKGRWFGEENDSLAAGKRQKLAFYRANHLPITQDFDQDFETDLCRELGPEWCVSADGMPVLYPNLLSLETLKQGAATLLHAKTKALKEGRWVDVGQPEIERRARICSTCPFNQDMPGCRTCGGAAGLVESILKGVSQLVAACPPTPFDDRLKACKVCACPLRSKICIDTGIIREHMPESQQKQLPDWCWIMHRE